MTLTCTDPSEVNDIIIDAKGAGSIPSITVRLINILNCLIGESHFSARQHILTNQYIKSSPPF